MFSLIRDVLMPAAPAVALIAMLVSAPTAKAEEVPADGTLAIAAAALPAARALPGSGAAPAEGRRGAAGTEEVAADSPDAPQCRRVDRIGKFTIRRCR
jgi:hypothetical protein